MSQAWASLSRKIFLLSLCIIVSACNGSYNAFEDDVDFNNDAKTADIETDNAEKISLAAIQSAYLAHYHSALYDFLDVSDLPEIDASELSQGTWPVPGTNTYIRDCISGSVTYDFTRAADEAHQVGDQVSLTFNQCNQGDQLYDGVLTGRYTKIKGLNNTFTETDTQTCLTNLQDELNLGDSQVIYVSGDDIKFRNVANTVEVDVIDYVFSGGDDDLEREDIILETLIIGKDEEIIIVNEILEPPVDALTSVNGDQLYSVQKLISEKHACQSYERTLSVTLNEFSTQKGDLTTILNGSVTLFEAQDTPLRLNQEIINSNFQTRVQQGNLNQSFQMSGYRVQKAVQLATNSYSYLFEGLVSSDAFGGSVELTSAGKLFGNFDDPYPFSGSLEIKGRDLERVNMIVTNLQLRLQVDFNGDSNGTGFGDIDIVIDTTWEDLLGRNFQQ